MNNFLWIAWARHCRAPGGPHHATRRSILQLVHGRQANPVAAQSIDLDTPLARWQRCLPTTTNSLTEPTPLHRSS